MKRIASILTAGIAAASLLAGCGSSSTGSTAAPTASSAAEAATEAAAEVTTEAPAAEETTQTAEAVAEETTEAAEETGTEAVSDETGAGNILVLYYSGTGHTKNIADMIASYTGADEYEVTPAEPYTEDDLRWSDENSRVNKEHEDESLQDVAFDSTDVPDWDSYTVVYVGYPIWWQDASWVMKSFVKNLDFTGKTVIPFCTSGSSPIGDSGSNLAAIAGTGDWLEGARFSAGASEEEVQTWVDSLGL